MKSNLVAILLVVMLALSSSLSVLETVAVSEERTVIERQKEIENIEDPLLIIEENQELSQEELDLEKLDSLEHVGIQSMDKPEMQNGYIKKEDFVFVESFDTNENIDKSMPLSQDNFLFSFVDNEGTLEAILTGYEGDQTDIVIPSQVRHTSGVDVFVKVIGREAFFDSDITSVFIPDSVINIEQLAFGNAIYLRKVSLSENLQQISAGAFLQTNINEVTIPDSVTFIGLEAFCRSDLKSVKLGANVEEISTEAFSGNNLTSLIIPDSVQIVGGGAFRNNQLNEVNIGSGLTVLSQSVFAWNNLKKIDIPNTVTSIGVSAFRTNKLEHVTIPEGVTTIGNGAFQENKLTQAAISKSVKTIGNIVFQNNPLEELTFFGQVEQLGNMIFLNTPLRRIIVLEEDIENYRSLLSPTVIEGVTEHTSLGVFESHYSEETKPINYIPERGVLTLEVIPRNRYQLENLETYQLVESKPVVHWVHNQITIQSGNVSFSIVDANQNDNGVYVAVVDGERLLPITVIVGDFLFDFSGTEWDSKATIVGYIGDATDIVIPSEAVNVESGWLASSPVIAIGEGAFKELNLTRVYISDSVKVIGAQAFQYNQLNEVIGMNSVESIESLAFSNNTLTELKLSESLQKIGAQSFIDNDLKKVVIPKNVRTIEQRAFADNKSLQEIEFVGSSVEEVGDALFGGTYVAKIRVPDAYLEVYREILTPNTMEFIQLQTILVPIEGINYIEGTENKQSVIEGFALTLKVDRMGYQLNETNSWQELTFNWFKNQKKLESNENTFIIPAVVESDNGRYHVEIGEGENRLVLSGVDLLVIPIIDPPLPPIEPGNPNPEVAENPHEGALSIRYVSSLDFGKIQMQQESQEVIALPSKDVKGNAIPNMVTIQDQRPKNQRDGWLLTVSQRYELMNGVQVILNPYADETAINELNLGMPELPFVVNNQAQSFAWTPARNPTGIVSFGMGQSNEEGAILSIPSGVGIGNYVTLLDWSLITGP